MVKLSKVEDRPTPPAVYSLQVYGCAIIASWAAVMIGYDSAFIGGTIKLDSFRSEFGLDTMTSGQQSNTSANIVSVYQAGCFFGALLGYPAGYYMGRRYGLMLASLVFVLGAGLMLGANGDRGLALIYAGRVIAGLGIGAASNLTPLYIAEIAPPAIRGMLVGFYEVSWQAGGLVGFWINFGVDSHMAPSHSQWLIPFAIQILPGGIFAIGCFFLRESPRWLMSKGRHEEAVKNLCWLRQLDEKDTYISEEVIMMENQLDHERELVGSSFFGPFRALASSKSLMYRAGIAGSLFLFQNGTGINAVNYYSPTIFASLGITGTNTGLLTTGVFGVIKTIASLIWIFLLIDKWGRRNLLLMGAAGGALSMYYIGGYIAIAKPAENPTGTLSSGGISAVAFFYIWTIFYSLSWNGTPWVVCAEMFPQHVRGVTQTFSASASNWLWNFVIARSTPQMFASMGFGVYLLFASMQVISIPFLVMCLPETKNIPLEEMDRLFAPGLHPWGANKVVMEQIRSERGILSDIQAEGAAEKGKSEFAHKEQRDLTP